MKVFRFIFAILMVVTLAAALSGAYHQLAFFLMSAIWYVVFHNEIQREKKRKKPYPRTFNIDHIQDPPM